MLHSVVNLMNPGDEHAGEGIHPGFENQGRYHQKSKEVSVAPQKGLMSSNFKKILKSLSCRKSTGNISDLLSLHCCHLTLLKSF